MFVTTANTLDILPALRDRMEIIKLSGYTEDEKLHIAEKHLIPKQLKENGLKIRINHIIKCDHRYSSTLYPGSGRA